LGPAPENVGISVAAAAVVVVVVVAAVVVVVVVVVVDHGNALLVFELSHSGTLKRSWEAWCCMTIWRLLPSQVSAGGEQ
jgi:hypothetical protein